MDVIHKFVEIVREKLPEIAMYQRLCCGKIPNLGKNTAAGMETSAMHTALTYMDTFTQDFLMLPILREFPFLVPLVEENTALKLHYANNDSAWTLIIDPIDGTQCYCDGNADYSILIGLLHRGKMMVGIGCYPHTGETYVAIRNGGAWYIEETGKQRKFSRPTPYCSAEKVVAVHYRFLNDPYVEMANRLLSKGYKLPTNRVDFGTGLTAILDIVRGKNCAFIAPNMTLHDFGVPSLLVEATGGAVRQFENADPLSWIPKGDTFEGLAVSETTPRFRVIIADSDATVNRILKDMNE
ncbi:hypothetical protein KKC32_02245 [Patescibacteria group bacterium]|nr:hypothetical protein [Patescibacteria group bacterium]